MTQSPRLLVAYKKSRYQQLVVEQQDPTIEGLLDQGHISVQNLKKSHDNHRRSLAELKVHLDDLGLDYELEYRGDVADADGFDLVIALGGDGTVLDLSHRIGTTPLVAVNSDPELSMGYFSAGTAYDFPRIIEKIVDDEWDPVELDRFHVALDGNRVGPPVLNDILISHQNPAAVSSYFLKVGPHPAEEQKSSGVWISTPAGSTAAIRSAGGLVLPFDSDHLQYLVREPFPPREGGYRFLKGIHPFDDGLEVISRMREGTVFVDGPHISFEFPVGCTLTIDPDAPPLWLYGLKEERRTA